MPSGFFGGLAGLVGGVFEVPGFAPAGAGPAGVVSVGIASVGFGVAVSVAAGGGAFDDGGAMGAEVTGAAAPSVAPVAFVVGWLSAPTDFFAAVAAFAGGALEMRVFDSVGAASGGFT